MTQFLRRVGDWFTVPTQCRRWGEKTQPGAWQWCIFCHLLKLRLFLEKIVCLHPGSVKMTVLS